MKHDQLLCDLIYLMVPDLMEHERGLRKNWIDPHDQIVGLNLQTLLSFVLLPKRKSSFKFEGIMKFAIEANVGHIKMALGEELNKRRPNSDLLDALDLRIFSGHLELPNILTLGDIMEHQLGWNLEEREEGLQYPVFHYRLFSEDDSDDSMSDESDEID